MGNRVMIIAEAGVNHNGSFARAKQMVDAAVEAGADAVKFQAFKAEALACFHAEKAQYQKKTDRASESQYQMLKKLELSQEEFRQLYGYCRTRDIQFMASAFDAESVRFLADLGLAVFKIPSGEITNLPYLELIGSLRSQIILSTGMAEEEEVEAALGILTAAGSSLGDITVLHCTTSYPAPFEQVNLNAMVYLSKKFSVKVGYSDHTAGIEAAIAAVALGATVIEKHFTLDKALEGPDHQASLAPHELKAMVKAIRNIEKALGAEEKNPVPADLQNRDIVRKSIVASRPITKGEAFTDNNITVKRPGTGISPMRWYDVLGRRAHINFEKDALITLP